METRELKVGDKGSDIADVGGGVVAQLGISPSVKPGANGVRAPGNIFTSGIPSIEKMVCRFNYISYAGWA